MSLCKYFKKNTSQSNYGHIIVFTLFNFQGPYRLSDFFVFRLFSVGDFLILPRLKFFVKSFFRFFSKSFLKFSETIKSVTSFFSFRLPSLVATCLYYHSHSLLSTLFLKFFWFFSKSAVFRYFTAFKSAENTYNIQYIVIVTIL